MEDGLFYSNGIRKYVDNYHCVDCYGNDWEINVDPYQDGDDILTYKISEDSMWCKGCLSIKRIHEMRTVAQIRTEKIDLILYED